jgi:pimeloyl-ACP methyl ester carboxylesterase
MHTPSPDRGMGLWEPQEFGPPEAEHTVLLLPGALCSTLFYDDLLADPRLSAGSIRFVAATLPGYGRTRPPGDPTIETYAGLAGRLAANHGCDVVVGHSLGANVAIEMAAAGHFHGPLVLLSPSFSRKDEAMALRVIDRVGRVFGYLPFAAMFRVFGPAMKSELPADRHEALVAELKSNDPRVVRRLMRPYLEYLDRHGSLVPRLCDSGANSWVTFGEHDDVSLQEEERRALEACPSVSLSEISDAGHFALNQQPAKVADLVLEAIAAKDAGTS